MLLAFVASGFQTKTVRFKEIQKKAYDQVSAP
jgi:hypothetical protein